MAAVASRQKVLKVVKSARETDPRAAVKAKDASDIAKLEQQEADRKANDPVSAPLDYGPYVLDQTPTQCFGKIVIDDFNGDVYKIPRYSFKRWYFRDHIIIDLFLTQRAYDEADVEGRRAMARKYGHRYAALGPEHHILPQQGQKFPSQVEQLGLC